ncbi:hypothetical protein L9F63_024683, partial [Diploptera punctata]
SGSQQVKYRKTPGAADMAGELFELTWQLQCATMMMLVKKLEKNMKTVLAVWNTLSDSKCLLEPDSQQQVLTSQVDFQGYT